MKPPSYFRRYGLGLKQLFTLNEEDDVLFLNGSLMLNNYTQTFLFLFCVSWGAENMVGTASSRSFTHLPVLSMYCSSK